MAINTLYILFLSFGIADAIDIFLVAVILYQLYKMVKGTAAVNVFIGLTLIYVVYIVSKGWWLARHLAVLMIRLIIVLLGFFQKA